MARKGIEEMISEIEIFIDNCKYQPLSSSKIIVPRKIWSRWWANSSSSFLMR